MSYHQIMNQNKELRERFNPEGSELRRQQLRMVELLDEVDRICKKYDIPYWLSAGTLLGAARHQGFIPWDDDLDVEMLRSDYFRLMEVLPKELPEHLALQSHDTDENYIYVYAKLRDKNSYMEEYCVYDKNFKEKGIYIDIFPLERIPRFFAWLGGHMHGQIYNQLNNQKLSDEVALKRAKFIFNLNQRFGFPLLRAAASLLRTKELRHALGTSWQKARHMEDIFPLTEIEFEGKNYPCPRNADAMLRKIYGDYMQLPDLENLKPHCRILKFYK